MRCKITYQIKSCYTTKHSLNRRKRKILITSIQSKFPFFFVQTIQGHLVWIHFFVLEPNFLKILIQRLMKYKLIFISNFHLIYEITRLANCKKFIVALWLQLLLISFIKTISKANLKSTNAFLNLEQHSSLTKSNWLFVSLPKIVHWAIIM